MTSSPWRETVEIQGIMFGVQHPATYANNSFLTRTSHHPLPTANTVEVCRTQESEGTPLELIKIILLWGKKKKSMKDFQCISCWHKPFLGAFVRSEQRQQMHSQLICSSWYHPNSSPKAQSFKDNTSFLWFQQKNAQRTKRNYALGL